MPGTPLDHGPLGRGDAGRPGRHGMHTLLEPRRSPAVELIDRGGDAVDLDLWGNRLLQLTERPLDLALALGVTGLARRDLHSVVSGELDRRRMQPEPPALRRAQRAHPIGAGDSRDAAERLEGPDDAFEGVLPVLAGREPPDALPGPRRDRPEAPQRVLPTPRLGDGVEVAEVELDLLTRVGVDRHRRRSRGPEPRPTDLPDRSHDGRIRTGVTLRSQLVEHRHGQQPLVLGQQRLDAFTPAGGHHPPLVGHLDPGRWAARLEPLGDGGRMEAELVGDLLVRPALVLERVQIHVLLLVHHESGGPFGRMSMLGRSTRWRGRHAHGWMGDQARRTPTTQREFT